MTELIVPRDFIEQARLSPEQISARTRQVHQRVLADSPWLDGSNFTLFHPDDLGRMFEEYDRLFFNGLSRRLLGQTPLGFRLSKRMTSAGGSTSRIFLRCSERVESYEITVSSTLLFQTFDDVERTIVVAGIECRNRLEAMQRIVEHEMIHLIEMLLWDRSKCAKARFQSMAARFFGHTDYRHRLVTPRERARARFGIGPGTRVRFRFEGADYVGRVNRITKRATVLVEDKRGRRFSDGKHYETYYIPVEMLEPLE